MSEDIIVKKSKISGLGVFANKNFKKGEIVLRWKNGKTFTKSQANKLSKKEKNYVLLISINKYILMQSPERYVNHSCNANTYANVKNFCDIASRNIKKGEEITSNYSHIKDLMLVDFKCQCGSKDCRKII